MIPVASFAQPKRAIVLLSGGLDSATALAIAASRGFECYALSVHYGQRHSAELDAARQIAANLGAREHRIMGVDLAGIGGSALTDARVAIPESPTVGIPVTYVPARNTLLLSLALGWAETVGALDIFVGVNAVDYSGYPDCRPEFIEAFERLARLATKAGVEGVAFKIQAPLIAMSKMDIIRTRHRTRRGLQRDRIVLPGARGWRRMRTVRFLPLARRRFQGCAHPRSHPISLKCIGCELPPHFGYHARLNWDGSSVGRARPF